MHISSERGYSIPVMANPQSSWTIEQESSEKNISCMFWVLLTAYSQLLTGTITSGPLYSSLDNKHYQIIDNPQLLTYNFQNL